MNNASRRLIDTGKQALAEARFIKTFFSHGRFQGHAFESRDTFYFVFQEIL